MPGILTPDNRRLLAAAIAAPHVAVPQWTAWRDTHSLADASRPDSRLFPIVAHNLQRAGHTDAELVELMAAPRPSWVKTHYAMADAVEVTLRLEAVGIPTMMLKGVDVQAFYDDPSLRPMGDVDLLVPEERGLDAFDQLLADGWAMRFPLPREVLKAALDGKGVSVRRDEHKIDLHWRATHGLSPGLDEPLWQHRRARRIGGADGSGTDGGEVFVPPPAHQLVVVLCHGLRDGSASVVQGLCDAAMLIRSGQCDPAMAVDLASRWSRLPTLRHGVRLLSEVSGDPLSRSFARSLPRARTAVRDHVAHRHRITPAGRVHELLGRIAGGQHEPERTHVVMKPGDRIVMDDPVPSLGITRNGWGSVERHGRWSVTYRSSLELEIEGDGSPHEVTFTGHGAQPVKRSSRVVRVRIDGRRVGKWGSSDGFPTTFRCLIPSGRPIRVEFRFNDLKAVGPKDRRLVGLFLKEVAVAGAGDIDVATR